MNDHDLRRVEALFDKARRLAPAERAELLDATDVPAHVRRDVEDLLRYANSADGFLEPPAAARARIGALEDRSQWIRLSGVIVAAKIVLLLIAFFVNRASGVPMPSGSLTSPWLGVLMIASFGGVGGVLVAGGRLDIRCRELGVFFLLIASAFSDMLGKPGHALGGLTPWLMDLRFDVFLPAFLWLFTRDFPVRAPLGWSFVFPSRAAAASFAIGAALFVANIAVGHVTSGSPLHHALELFSRSRQQIGPAYWTVVFGLMLPAAYVLVERARHVGPTDQRRVRHFITALLAGLLPVAADSLLRAADAALKTEVWASIIGPGAYQRAVDAVVIGGLLSVPITTAYAVMVTRVADLRLIIRQALQYAVAKWGVLAMAAVPFVLLVTVIYQRRTATVQELLTGADALWIGVSGGLAAVAWRTHPKVLGAIDRRFFREQYDTRRILAALVDAVQRAPSADAVTELLTAEVDKALHLDRVAVLVAAPSGRTFISRGGSMRPLAADTTIGETLRASGRPIRIGHDDPSGAFRVLNRDEQSWVVDGGVRLLVPLPSGEGTLAGILALGEKKSELPFSDDDLALLGAVGAAGGLGLAGRRLADWQRESARLIDAATAARECQTCGLLHDTSAEICSCGGALDDAPLPLLVAGDYAVERRLAAGGMGVVYRATQRSLARTVAIKTLPATNATDTWRLRREARAMALVSHDNLAVIYAVESWNGVPLLIEEFLHGGTLADRLARGPLPVDQAIELGILLGRALQTLHNVGMLHRDIKPSNIGYTEDGRVKLLDFGLAQMVTALDPAASSLAKGAADGVSQRLGDPTRRIVGTPAYMSPEAIRGERPSAAFDLWSLAVVLVEALSGRNPFRGETLYSTVQRINAPDREALLDGAPPLHADIAALLTSALDSDRQRRPQTAAEFSRRLKPLSAPRTQA